MGDLLSTAGFVDRKSAERCLQRLSTRLDGEGALPIIIPSLLQALSHAAEPDRVLVDFERFTQSFENATNPLHILENHPRAIEVLVTLFAGSQFLTEILLRNADQFELLLDLKRLATQKGNEQVFGETQAVTARLDSAPEKMDALRRYQRQELLRIGTCDLLGLYDTRAVTRQLSNLADALVQACLAISADLSGIPGDRIAVVALGKLGGQELNYSSDIDLLFLSETASSEHLRLGELLIETLARVTAEGFLYRVDMRLRPWGKDGSLVSSLDGYFAYLSKYAQIWEKQALLKARFIAGDWRTGEAFLHQMGFSLFSADLETIRQHVHAMKQRTEAHLRQQGRAWGEVKLGEGSIRDVEFVAQFHQLALGAAHPAVLTPNTLLALDRLYEQGALLSKEHRVLKDGYIFLRTVEHHLQIMHYQQTYTLPSDRQALAQLAKRLGFQDPVAGEQFVDRYEQHCAAIRAIYLRHVGNNRMNPPGSPQQAAESHQVAHHLGRMDPSYAAVFSVAEIEQHAAMAEKLSAEHLVEVETTALEDEGWRITVVAYDYPGELSLICGLLFVHGFNIDDGLVFTYEPSGQTAKGDRVGDVQRIIVDVFTVRFTNGEIGADAWQRYANDLEGLLRAMQAGERRQARGELAKRVAEKLTESASAASPLYPIEITIDNGVAEKYTVLQIKSQDTAGFLYELTNALALHSIYIAQVRVESQGSRIFDTLYVTDANGQKILEPSKQHELRAAILLIKHFTHLLPYSANPETALLHFRAFIEKLFQQHGWPEEITSLGRPEVLRALAQVLGVSDFLWEDFLRMQYENLFPVVRDIDDLAEAKTKADLQQEITAYLSAPPEQYQDPIYGTGWRAAVNAFKDRQLFRIDMRHILGYTGDFAPFSQELTDLTETVVQATCQQVEAELAEVHGMPVQEDGNPCTLTVCALGKCGGRELGFASDIELMFVYQGKGQTRGAKAISAAEYYEKLVQLFLGAIRARREGVFQIDLQLRPYGKAGSMAVSLAAFRNYFAPQGAAWAYERQALIRLRPIAGDAALGAEVAALRDEFVYSEEPFDVTAMRAMRERQIRHLVSGGTFNAKYSPGGLLDVEYLVQGLQINYGHLEPSLRHTNTREAMAALAERGILSPEDYTRLHKAHTFLRWLIDSLRVVRGNAKDLTVPPYGSDEFEYLTRRLRYDKDIQRLRDELERFTADVQALNRKYLP